MEKILVANNNYDGQYVAIKSINDNTIVGSGNTPEKALNEANGKGFKSPFLLYIPDENLVHIYHVN